MTPLSQEERDALQAAVGREERREQLLDSESLRRFHVATGADESPRPASPLAHWAWFHGLATDTELGDDGHPRRGGFLPAVATLPRRMFVGTSVSLLAPVLLDAPAMLVSRIAAVDIKQGSTGLLMFVTVERRLRQSEADALVERQTLVYRPPATAPMPLPAPIATPEAPDGERWWPNALQLFRFSAATFNSHRIHYDKRYTTEVERYPDLVVQGPLVAARLAAVAARRRPVASLTYRALLPMFVDQPIDLVMRGDDHVEARRCDGAVSATISVH